MRNLFRNSACHSWSKAVIIKAFKTVAKRAYGPVGVVITVGSFAACMGWINTSFFGSIVR